jgi:hypothetical protein
LDVAGTSYIQQPVYCIENSVHPGFSDYQPHATEVEKSV